jgi:hypothetical protein
MVAVDTGFIYNDGHVILRDRVANLNIFQVWVMIRTTMTTYEFSNRIFYLNFGSADV